MAREPEDLAEMRRALGAQLAAFRQAADLTQGQVARTAFVDRTTVTHIEKGRVGGTELFWTLVDRANSMHRREVLQLLGWAATTVAATPAVTGLNPDEQVRLARALVSPSRVDEQVIDHLAAMLAHCKRQEDALGSRAVLSTALAQRDLIRSLLADCPTALRPRLLSVYSDISTSIAYYFFELNNNNFDSAWHYHKQARAAAQDAGNAEFDIYALCEMIYTASWYGKTQVGIDLAATAQSLARKTDDPLMRVGAAQRAATAYAADGQYKECMVESDRAQDGPASAEELVAKSPGYFFNEGYLISHKNECLLRLGKPQEAADAARAGLALYDKSFVDGYAVCTLHLGNAHLQCDEIDEAARVIGQAAGLAAQTRSARLAKELPRHTCPAAAVGEHPSGQGTG